MGAEASRGLLARAAAAHELLRAEPGIDRYALLAEVVWPSPALERASAATPRRVPVTQAEVDAVLELRAEGLSFSAIGERLGRPTSTCKFVAGRYAAPP